MRESGITEEPIDIGKPEIKIDRNKLLQEVVDIATDKTKEFKIEIPKRNWFHGLQQKLGFAEKERTYILRRLRVNNSMKMSALAQKIPDELVVGDFIKFAIDNCHLYGDILIESCAIAIQNDRKEPSKELLDVVRYDFEWSTIQEILDWAWPQVATSFFNTIVSVKGTTEILRPKTSPLD